MAREIELVSARLIGFILSGVGMDALGFPIWASLPVMVAAGFLCEALWHRAFLR